MRSGANPYVLRSQPSLSLPTPRVPLSVAIDDPDALLDAAGAQTASATKHPGLLESCLRSVNREVRLHSLLNPAASPKSLSEVYFSLPHDVHGKAVLVAHASCGFELLLQCLVSEVPVLRFGALLNPKVANDPEDSVPPFPTSRDPRVLWLENQIRLATSEGRSRPTIAQHFDRVAKLRSTKWAAVLAPDAELFDGDGLPVF